MITFLVELEMIIFKLYLIKDKSSTRVCNVAATTITNSALSELIQSIDCGSTFSLDHSVVFRTSPVCNASSTRDIFNSMRKEKSNLNRLSN